MAKDMIKERREKIISFFKGVLKRYKWYDIALYVVFFFFLLSAVRYLAGGGNAFVFFLYAAVPILGVIFVYYKKRGYALFPFVVLFGVFIRIQNLPLLKDKYPLALDPHYFLRIARYILEHGSVMAHDAMRYAPLGLDTARENVFLSYVIVYVYKFLSIFDPSMTIEKADILYPVIFFALGIIVFFFFVKELFNTRIAVVSSFLLVIVPTFLYRTMAGFSDKEALATFFMFLAFYLYIKSSRSKNLSYTVIFGLLAGISTGFMGLSWGGVKFALVTIAAFNMIIFLLGRAEKRHFYAYISWIIPFTIMLSFFTQKLGGFKGLVTSTSTGICYAVLGVYLADILIRKFTPLHKKIRFPKSLTTIIAAAIVGFVGGFLIFGLDFVKKLFSEIGQQLLHPMSTSRLMLTVAEARQPYFAEWWGDFSSFLLVFFIGSIFMFYIMVKDFKAKIVLTASYIIFIILLLASRHSPDSVLNGNNLLSSIVFLGAFVLFFIGMAVMYIRSYYRSKNIIETIRNIELRYFFVFAWFILMLVAARGGIRLFYMLTPAATLMAGYLIAEGISLSLKMKDKVYKIVVILIILMISVPSIYSFSFGSVQQARYTGPSYNSQWQIAMEWVNEKTPADSVFAHWWDYGYWVQTGGNRATITDGGNFIPYWNHLMGRNVLAARSYEEALQFLKVHNTTHLLIISDEIGKYTAYSSIGSDETFDIFSWIGTYLMVPQATREEEGATMYTFYGGTSLDEDFVYEGKVFPQKKAYIGAFFIPVVEDEDYGTFEIKQPTAAVFHNNERTNIPVECVYDEGIITFEKEGLKGCLRIFPKYLNYQYQQENGALLYVSRKGLNALWTKLFLFNENPDSFELVYDDSGINQLAYFNGRIMGPLKIWKVNYPGNLTISDELREKYLAKTTPEWEKLNERSVLAE